MKDSISPPTHTHHIHDQTHFTSQKQKSQALLENIAIDETYLHFKKIDLDI